jgi:hypothetical protein
MIGNTYHFGARGGKCAVVEVEVASPSAALERIMSFSADLSSESTESEGEGVSCAFPERAFGVH